MKEITVVTTVQMTDIVRFEDSPELYNDIINSMDEVRENIIEEVRHQNSLADDVNVKVQFFVNDSDDAGSDKPQNHPLFKASASIADIKRTVSETI